MISLLVNEKLVKEYDSGDVYAIKYRNLVRNLLYLITTRSDIMYVSELLSRFMNQSSNTHFGVVKRRKI
jgi:hypothetical protein